MAFVIEKTEKLSLTTTAKEVDVACRSFLLKNADAEKALYFKECSADDTDVTVDNGFMLSPGEITPVVLSARTLSIKGAASLSAYIMYGREE